MIFQNIVQLAKIQFPKLEIKYKDESLFMKILGKLLFFNKTFMTNYTTTIGSTVYFPTKSFVESRETSATVILLHELVHVNDASKITAPLFSLLYLCPQILTLLFFPLLFISWKIAILAVFFATPLPAYFRMHFEKRAYMTSLYSLNALGKKLNFNPLLDSQKDSFIKQFKTSAYYWMWIFPNINKQFDEALVKVRNNERPFQDPIFDVLDKLIANS